MLVKGDDSWMFQIPGTNLVERQAELCNCNWLPVSTQGVAEDEVDDLKACFDKPRDRWNRFRSIAI